MSSTIHVVVISSPAEDVPVLEEALSALELTPSSFSDVETKRAQTFLLADDEAAAETLAAQVTPYLSEWTEMLTEQPQVEVKTMRQEDWANSWKKNFHTFRASERLVVKPSWEEYTSKPGDIVVPIDPGMCFGTGYHGTTKACLQFLDKLQRENGSGLSLIDAGTGSGILSIAAALLGYGRIEAFDNDPDCIGQSQENLATAGVTSVTVSCAALGEYIPTQVADVAVANILASILAEHVEDVKALARPGGWLILSGILTEQYDGILQKFTAAGCQELSRVTIQEWTSGLFRRGV